MARPKGSPKPPGSGRKKGTPNKATKTVREAWIEAFALVNEKIPLHDWGAANPDKFYSLSTKLVPIEMTGANGAPLVPPVVRVELVDPTE